MSQVRVIIVTYNSADTITDCIDSVLRQNGVRQEVVVVDNASTDGTADKIRGSFPDVRLLSNRENVGFGRANNQGARAARESFLYLLNPDAQLTGSEALLQLAGVMKRYPQWGLTGTRVLSQSGVNEAPPSMTYPDQERAEHQFDQLPGTIAWVIGASMFIRRDAYERVGGFDQQFFLHSEETDLCLRLRKSGYTLGYVDEVTVRHIGGVSERTTNTYTAWMRRRNGLHRFWTKHYTTRDVRRLAHRDLIRSRWRVALYRGISSISRSPQVMEKLMRYRATHDTTLQLWRQLE